MTRVVIIIMVLVAWCSGSVFSQEVGWSFFSSGAARSQSASTTLVSAVGEPFVGFSQTGTVSLHSGSLTRAISIVTGLSEGDEPLPREYALYQNYPNPFNPSTTVQYDLPTATMVTLRIFDILGRQVFTMVNGEQPAGAHRVTVSLPHLSSGVYFYRIQAGDFVQTRRFMLLK